MSNEKYNAAAAGLTLAAIDGAQMTIESLRKDREYVITLLAAAQQEIASLKVRVWQCGAGAGCCAQAARIKELEAQLEAVGAGGVSALVRRAAAGALTNEGTIAAQSQHEHWATPTTVLQRTGDALQLLCAGQRPPDAIITGWLDNSSEELQAFCCQYGPSWCQGIAVIDAAMLMVDQPTEIVTPESSADHEHRAAPVEAVGEMRASESLGVAPYADIWGWLQPGTKLYSATQVQAMLSHGIAPGWQAVPVEPTSEMVIEAYEAQGEATSSACEEIYRAMLAAAPQPAVQAGWCDGCSPDNCGGCMTSAAPAQAGEPWYGHKFKESQSGIWRCECGKTVKEATADWLDSVLEDAARYRWLRINAIGAFRTNDGNGPVSVYHLSKIPAIPGIPEETDAAIDAAIAAQQGEKHE